MEITLTGTRAFGPARKDSDWDFVMCYWDADIIRRILAEEGIEVQDQSEINPVYLGFKVTLGSTVIQVICASSREEYKQWKYATKQMLNISPIEDRDERHRQFQKFFTDKKSCL